MIFVLKFVIKIRSESKNKDKKDLVWEFLFKFYLVQSFLLTSETERVLLYQSSSGLCEAIFQTQPFMPEPAFRGNISELTLTFCSLVNAQ